MIALLGATGRVGRHVAAGLAEASVEARALVRADAVLPVPTRRADLRDPATVRAALEGCDQLFLVTPHGPDQDLLERTAVDAAVAAGVRRIVKVSGGAATLGPNGVTTTAVAHWRSEQRIEASGLRFAFLRPSFMTQNLLDTVAPVVAKAGVLPSPFGRAPIAMVDARDVAAAAVAALRDPDAADCAWQLTGPRGVGTDAIARRLGARHVSIAPRVAGKALARQGASAWEADHATRMATYFTSGADGFVTGDLRALTGAAPRTVDAFLTEHADAFRPATGLARALHRRNPSKELR